MNPFSIRLLFAVTSIALAIPSKAQNPADAPGLMQNLSRACESIKPIKNRPVDDMGRRNQNFYREVSDFEQAEKFIAHYVEELHKIDKNFDFNRVVDGKPLSDTLKAAQEIIKTNHAILGDTPTPIASNLIRSLAEACRNLMPLTATELEPSNYSLITFRKNEAEITACIQKLQALGVDVKNSKYPVNGIPICETLKRAQEVIQSNNQTLAAMPTPKAIDALDMAIRCAKVGKMRLDEGKLSEMAGQYQVYSKFKAEAVAIDPKVLEYRKKEIQKVESEFVAPFMAIVEKMKQQKEAQRRDEEAGKRAEMARQEAADKQKDAIAKKKGFSSSCTGVAELISELRNSITSLEDAKKILIFADGRDQLFEVSSTDDKYIFYATVSGEFLQIAVERVRGELNSNGSPLTGNMFSVVGSGRFQTALGTGVDLVILRRIQ